MKLFLPLLYSQYDSRWANDLLGFNTDPKYNFYNYACLLCCLADILYYYGISVTPETLNKVLMDNKAFEPNSGLYDWGSLNRIYSQITDSIVPTPGRLTDAQMGEMRSAIDAGYPVVIQIDYNPKTIDADMHFVTIVAYNPGDENDFTIADSLGGRLHSLKDYLGWFRPDARTTIQAYGIIKGPVPVLGQDDTLPVSKAVFPNLVHGSTQWDKTVDKWLPGSNPTQANFEDVTTILGGYKSLQTAAENKNAKLSADLATETQTVTNLTEKLAHQDEECQSQAKLYQARIDALKPNGDAIDNLDKVYQTRINDITQKMNTLIQEKHDLATENARLKNQTPVSLFDRWFPTLAALLSRKGK